jgi:hypothetical protein
MSPMTKEEIAVWERVLDIVDEVAVRNRAEVERRSANREYWTARADGVSDVFIQLTAKFVEAGYLSTLGPGEVRVE